MASLREDFENCLSRQNKQNNDELQINMTMTIERYKDNQILVKFKTPIKTFTTIVNSYIDIERSIGGLFSYYYGDMLGTLLREL